ncbi:MAG: hypothetical protein ACREB6_11580 [Rhodospirillales bacterium]
MTTSGVEYESLYAIWKYMHGLTVYADHTRIPFAGTFYNWVYYAFYGEITRLVLAALSLGDVWLPTVTRLITIGGIIYGAWMSALVLMMLAARDDDDFRRLGLALAFLIFFGPLIGFFGMATQPDVWGVAFDVTALYFFLRFYDARPAAAVSLFWVFVYLAWGFKQIFVYSTGAVGLFLLVRRDWRMFAMLAGLSILGWGATLAVGSDQYVKNILLFGGVSVMFEGAQLVRNIGNTAVKILPVLFGLFGIAAAMATDRAVRLRITEAVTGVALRTPRGMFWFAAIAVVVTCVVVLPASAKLGAAENYYFMLSFLLALMLLAALAADSENKKWPAPVPPALSLGWLLHIAAVGMVLGGIIGTLSPRPLHASLTELRDCLLEKNLTEPFFVAHPYLSLPWMIPADQHFVIHGNYRWDTRRGIEMEGGGIGGLIDRGYFATIAVPRVPYDGSALQRYRPRVGACGAFRIYDRIGGRGE